MSPLKAGRRRLFCPQAKTLGALFQTNLDILLRMIAEAEHVGNFTKARTIVRFHLDLAGVLELLWDEHVVASDICVLFSANDAYMRDFQIAIPSDCVASEEAKLNRQALMLMQRALKADTTPSTTLEFEHTKIIFPKSSTASKARNYHTPNLTQRN